MRSRFTTATLLATGTLLASFSADAAPVDLSDLVIFSHGDSITYGVIGDGRDASGTLGAPSGDFSNSQFASRGSYRRFLDMNLGEAGTGFTFVGGRDDRDSYIINTVAGDGTSNIASNYNAARGGATENYWWNGDQANQLSDPNNSGWYRHYAIPGISANDTGNTYSSGQRINWGVRDSDVKTAGSAHSTVRSLVDRIYDTSGLGTGVVNDASKLRDPERAGAPAGDFQQFVFGNGRPSAITLHIGTNSIAESPGIAIDRQLGQTLETYQLLTTTTDPSTGSTYLASDVDIYLAKILPKIEGGTTLEEVYNETLAYNQQIESFNSPGSRDADIYGNLSASFLDNIVIVDMFAILVSDVSAGVAQALGISEADVLAAIQKDDDEFVDWVLADANSSINEGSTDPLAANAIASANFDLLGDELHPNELGYAVMGEVWTLAFQANGSIPTGVIPEPATAAVLAMGAGGLLLRRRRRYEG